MLSRARVPAHSQVGFLTKALMSFNAVLTFYILNSQDRRFAAVDAEAKQALERAKGELSGSVGDALSFGKMFSGAFGSKFGASSAPQPPPAAPAAPTGGGISRLRRDDGQWALGALPLGEAER